MTEFLSDLGVELPIVQAGMGGGLAGARLAAAVSAAGGLGTIGFVPPGHLRSEIARVRRRTDKPVAVNLLLNFARGAHWAAAADADVIVTFWGRPRRHSERTWIHQVGSIDEARAAYDAGADAVIVQGVEAGGHVRGTTPSLELLEQVKKSLPVGYPLLLAGGIAEAGDVQEALAAGAVAAVAGTRFLMSEESGASSGYKERLQQGSDTVLTELFGVGWPGAHRVLPNGATDRWLGKDARGPTGVRALNRLTRPALTRTPDALQAWMVRHQSVRVPLFSPTPAAGDVPPEALETSPLYAGETVARIDDIAPAATLVKRLMSRT